MCAYICLTPRMTCGGHIGDEQSRERFAEYAEKERARRRISAAIESSKHMRAVVDGVPMEVEMERQKVAKMEEWRRKVRASIIFREGEVIEGITTAERDIYDRIGEALKKISTNTTKEMEEVERMVVAEEKDEQKTGNLLRVGVIKFILTVNEKEKDKEIQEMKGLYFGCFFDPDDYDICWVNASRMHRMIRSTRARVATAMNKLNFEMCTDALNCERLRELLGEYKLHEKGWVKYHRNYNFDDMEQFKMWFVRDKKREDARKRKEMMLPPPELIDED